MRRQDTFAERVRTAAAAIQDKEPPVTLEKLQVPLLVQTYEDKNRLYEACRDMCRRGEMQRVGRGVYDYKGRQRAALQKQSIMWRYLRSGRSFGGVTTEELQEVAGASLDYVQEWTDLLVRRGVIKQIGDKWQLISDLAEPPVNDEKSERLRAIRERKKQRVISALERAGSAVAEALKFLRGAEVDNEEKGAGA